jgi:hypothetical protein
MLAQHKIRFDFFVVDVLRNMDLETEIFTVSSKYKGQANLDNLLPRFISALCSLMRLDRMLGLSRVWLLQVQQNFPRLRSKGLELRN